MNHRRIFNPHMRRTVYNERAGKMKIMKYSFLIVVLVVCISVVNTLSAPEMAK